MTTRPMTEIKPGDILDGFSSNPDTLVTAVEPAEPLGDGTPMVRMKGRLGRREARNVQGDPSKQEFQKKVHTWSFRADQTFDVIEPGVIRYSLR